MHIVVALLGIIGAAYFWAHRARDAADIAKRAAEVPGDIKAAARRFGFKRKSNQHAVDGLDEPKLGIAAIAGAFVSMQYSVSDDTLKTLRLQVQSHLQVDANAAEELLILGAWLVNECGTPAEGIRRISRRLVKIAAKEPVAPLLGIVKDTLKDNWNEDQLVSLETVKRIFQLS